ncbi:MAG: O-antigen ligase family protein [Marinobacter sp.]|nr:O-antigen ligase family protein [Marinobacter sp.]
MAVVIIILGISGGLYVADDQFWDRMRTMENVEDEGASGSQRINYWLAALDISTDYPLGAGIYGFNFLSDVYLPPEYQGGEGGKSVHSLWFQGLSEVGWPGDWALYYCAYVVIQILQKGKTMGA